MAGRIHSVVRPPISPVILQTRQAPELPRRPPTQRPGPVTCHDPLFEHSIAAVWPLPCACRLCVCTPSEPHRSKKEETETSASRPSPEQVLECPEHLVYEAILDDVPRIVASVDMSRYTGG